MYWLYNGFLHRTRVHEIIQPEQVQNIKAIGHTKLGFNATLAFTGFSIAI